MPPFWEAIWVDVDPDYAYRVRATSSDLAAEACIDENDDESDVVNSSATVKVRLEGSGDDWETFDVYGEPTISYSVTRKDEDS